MLKIRKFRGIKFRGLRESPKTTKFLPTKIPCRTVVQIIPIIASPHHKNSRSSYTKTYAFRFQVKGSYIMNMCSHNLITAVAVYRSSRESLWRHPLREFMWSRFNGETRDSINEQVDIIILSDVCQTPSHIGLDREVH